MNIRFLLICEGSSDEALVPHIEKLLVDCGAREANGAAFSKAQDSIDKGKRNTASYRGKIKALTDKVNRGIKSFKFFGDSPDLLFVHRDADQGHNRETNAAGPEKRYSQITDALVEYSDPYVGIVPVRMTEAWLLVDEDAIRRVVGNSKAQHRLDLPPPRKIETIANPKERLKDILLQAGSPKGTRRREKLKGKFPGFRRQLIEGLPVGGPLEDLQSWMRFREETIAALQVLEG